MIYLVIISAVALHIGVYFCCVGHGVRLTKTLSLALLLREREHSFLLWTMMTCQKWSRPDSGLAFLVTPVLYVRRENSPSVFAVVCGQKRVIMSLQNQAFLGCSMRSVTSVFVEVFGLCVICYEVFASQSY